VRPERERLLDFVLGELGPEDARAVQARVDAEPELSAERDTLMRAMGLIREAAAEGWTIGRPAARLRWLRPALAVAAVLALAFAFLLTNGVSKSPAAVYEPDVALGYLLGEETTADGRVPRTGGDADAFVMRSGVAKVKSIGSTREFDLPAGATVPAESEIHTTEDGARVDLPDGGVLFMAPYSTVQCRVHQDGDAALRLINGTACTVAATKPIHLAVHGTDLLLVQDDGAAMLRKAQSDAVCLRGTLRLKLSDGSFFAVPEAERLPAACAQKPVTTKICLEDLELDWYAQMVYRHVRWEDVEWETPGTSRPITDANGDTLVYLRALPKQAGTLRVAFGGEAREFDLAAGQPLRIRLRLEDLGPGPALVVSPAAAVKEARLLSAQPR